MNISEFKDYVDIAFAPYVFFQDHTGIDGVFYALHKKIMVVRYKDNTWLVTDKPAPAQPGNIQTWPILSLAIDAFFEERGWIIHEPDDDWYPDWEKLES